MVGRSKCCVPYSGHIHRRNLECIYATFPKDIDRYRTWVRNMGVEDFIHLPVQKLNKIRYVCSCHFEKVHFLNDKRNHLKQTAIPTLIDPRVVPVTDMLMNNFSPKLDYAPSPEDVVSVGQLAGATEFEKTVVCCYIDPDEEMVPINDTSTTPAESDKAKRYRASEIHIPSNTRSGSKRFFNPPFKIMDIFETEQKKKRKIGLNVVLGKCETITILEGLRRKGLEGSIMRNEDDTCIEYDKLGIIISESLRSMSLHTVQVECQKSAALFQNIVQDTCRVARSIWTGESFRPPCQDGLMATLSAMQDLWRYLTEKVGFKRLNLRQLNQDPIENLFGAIRQHGVTNANPTCSHFEAALKTTIVSGVSGTMLSDLRNLLRSSSTSHDPASVGDGWKMESGAEASEATIAENNDIHILELACEDQVVEEELPNLS